MSGKSIDFDDKKYQKSEYYKNKKLTRIDDVDVNKVLVSKKKPYGTRNAFKYFIGYNDDDDIRLLCLRLLQMTGYAKKLMKMQQYLLELTINSFYKNIMKYGKKSKSY